MGNNIFGANISGQLAAALGSKVGKLVLRKNVMAPRDPANPGAGRVATPTDYKCRGWMDAESELQPATVGSGSNPPAVVVDNNTVSILGDTIKGGKIKPVVEDQILVGASWFTIKKVISDPDAALHVCVCG